MCEPMKLGISEPSNGKMRSLTQDILIKCIYYDGGIETIAANVRTQESNLSGLKESNLSGLVWGLSAVLDSPSELSQWPCHDYSSINTVLSTVSVSLTHQSRDWSHLFHELIATVTLLNKLWLSISKSFANLVQFASKLRICCTSIGRSRGSSLGDWNSLSVQRAGDWKSIVAGGWSSKVRWFWVTTSYVCTQETVVDESLEAVQTLDTHRYKSYHHQHNSFHPIICP